ncbi:hypothetical protein F5Y10DRAFT_233590 [Nemania abortiva]|nr:hypothetical protein F5Y10DRAFT_233590 [Nemania abortiva]
MKRQQSSQGGVPKRHCPAQQRQPFAPGMQGNQPQMSQLITSSSNSYQVQEIQAPQQPAQQQGYYRHTYNNNFNSAAFMQPNSMVNNFQIPQQFSHAHYSRGYFIPAPFTSTHFTQAPFARTAANQAPVTTAASTPGQLSPPMPSPATLTQAQSTCFDMSLDIASINDAIRFSVQHPGDMTGFYHTQQQPSQPRKPRQPQRVISPPVIQPNASKPPVNITASMLPNGTTPPPQNIPAKVPLQLPEGYELRAWVRKATNDLKDICCHQAKDARGVDLTQLGKPKPSKSLSPRPEPKISPVTHATPPLESAAPERPALPSPGGPGEVRPVAQPVAQPIAQPVVQPAARPAAQRKARPVIQPAAQPAASVNPVVSRPSNPAPPVDLGGLEAIKAFLDASKEEEAKAVKANKTDNSNSKPIDIPGPFDMTGYPAECYNNIRLPGCPFRAEAICIGGRYTLVRDRNGVERRKRWIMYGVRRPDSDDVEFKLVEPGSTIGEILKSPETQLQDVQLNCNFADMSPQMIVQWVRYLLAAVPRVDDAVVVWAPVPQSRP